MNMAIRAIAAGAIAILVVMAVFLMRYDPAPVANETVGGEIAGFLPLPAGAASASSSAILARSPFDPARQPYSRQPAAIDMPVQDVRLTGIVGAGGSRRASLVINGETRTFSAGDETPLGAVAAVEADAVILSDGRRLGLFE